MLSGILFILALLSLGLLLHTAVKEECHMSILLSLGNTELFEAMGAYIVSQCVLDNLRGISNGQRQSLVILSGAYIAERIHSLFPLEAVKTIKAAGGVAVLAHPLIFVNKGVLDDLICGLKPFGLDGIEANYPSHTPQITAHLYEVARKYRLIATGGTDYHGKIRPVEMGSVEWRIDGYSKKILQI